MDLFNSKLSATELADLLSNIKYRNGAEALEVAKDRVKWLKLGRAALVRLIEEEMETV